MKTLFIPLILLLICASLQAQQTEPNITRLTISVANVHVYQSNGKTMLIDAGHEDKVDLLEKKLRRKGIDPAEVDYILLTHGHADHAGGALHFQQSYGTKVIAGAADSSLFRIAHDPPLKPTSKLAVWVDKNIVKDKGFTRYQPDVWVHEQLDLAELGMQGEVRVVPGHTAGSLVLVVGQEALVGDLIRGALMAGRLPRRHFFHEDVDAAESHLQPLLEEGIVTFHLGHKGPLKQKRVRKFVEEHTPAKSSPSSTISNR